jgi:hypothetical protein
LKNWEAKLIDTGDGSGASYVEFPKELLGKVDWLENDVINLKIIGIQLNLTKANV